MHKVNERKVTVRILGVRQHIEGKAILENGCGNDKRGKMGRSCQTPNRIGCRPNNPIFTDRTQIKEGGVGFVKD